MSAPCDHDDLIGLIGLIIAPVTDQILCDECDEPTPATHDLDWTLLCCQH